MHMADALLSPAVGATLWLASGAALAWSSRCVRRQGHDRLVPLMGVLGAFVFAAQMLNFAIPGTGSSGHLGGGLLLAILLGPHAALVAMASVLTVQALFFADGGLLALGCNIFNLGVLPCWVAYALCYRPLAGQGADRLRITAACVAAGILGLQLGSLGVVLQTVASGVSGLPADLFLALMQPIHLTVGIVEGLATAAIVLFAWRARPELRSAVAQAVPSRPLRRVVLPLAAVSLGMAGLLSGFASPRPDGLEWSIERASLAVASSPREAGPGRLESLQAATAVMPHYERRGAARETAVPGTGIGRHEVRQVSAAGVLGVAITLALVTAAGAWLRRRRAAA